MGSGRSFCHNYCQSSWHKRYQHLNPAYVPVFSKDLTRSPFNRFYFSLPAPQMIPISEFSSAFSHYYPQIAITSPEITIPRRSLLLPNIEESSGVVIENV